MYFKLDDHLITRFVVVIILGLDRMQDSENIIMIKLDGCFSHNTPSYWSRYEF